MNILIMTIPISLTLGILFLLFFLSAVSQKQFEDLDTSAQLPLSDDEVSDEFINEVKLEPIKLLITNLEPTEKEKDNLIKLKF